MHLDGARLLLMSGMPGFRVRDYCAQLGFNESILRRDTDYLIKALAGQA